MGFIIFIIVTIIFGPSVLFLVIALNKRNSRPDTAKIFYILAAGWLLVAGGTCATLLVF